jgi:glycosyltransferase involved in cell wall biosynthesis
LKILIVHRYFKPNKTPCSEILYEVANFLGNKNYVDVLSSIPKNLSKKELNNFFFSNIYVNFKINRITLFKETEDLLIRIINSIKLSFHIIKNCLKKNYDVVIVTSTPPILCAFVTTIILKIQKKRMIYFCMDLNPELSLVLNDLKKTLFYKILMFLDNYSCKFADPVLVHSRDMEKTLRDRIDGQNYKIKILNNFAIDQLTSNQSLNEISNKYFDENKLKIIYAGNIGRFQNLDFLIQTLEISNLNEKIQLLIMGDGINKKKIQDKLMNKKLKIKFLDYQNPTVAKEIIKEADLGFVTLYDNVYKYSYPSKIMTYLQQGVPLLCMVEKNSELIEDMLSMNYGFWCNNNDIKSLSDLLINLTKDKSWKKKLSVNAINAFKKKFSSNIVLNKWSEILEKKKI